MRNAMLLSVVLGLVGAGCDGHIHEGEESGSTEAKITAQCRPLLAGETMERGETLWSCNGQYALQVMPDGNLALWGPGGLVWSITADNVERCLSGGDVGQMCSAHSGERLVMQPDGRLTFDGQTRLSSQGQVFYEAYASIFDSTAWSLDNQTPGVGGGSNPHLIVGDDGNLVVWNGDGGLNWKRF